MIPPANAALELNLSKVSRSTFANIIELLIGQMLISTAH